MSYEIGDGAMQACCMSCVFGPAVFSLYFSYLQYFATEIKMLCTDAHFIIVKPTLGKKLTKYVVTTALVTDNSLLSF